MYPGIVTANLVIGSQNYIDNEAGTNWSCIVTIAGLAKFVDISFKLIVCTIFDIPYH